MTSVPISADPTPLYVDLDGTLVEADTTLEAFVAFAKRDLRSFFLLLVWLTRGRAYAKARVSRRMPVDATLLPYRADLLQEIEAARAEGRPVILATGSHRRTAQRVARHLGLFDHVIATHRRRNLIGTVKLEHIRRHSAEGPFDYIGDSRADVPLWRQARHAVAVGPRARPGTHRLIQTTRPPLWRALLKAIRPHQWSKNFLVFVPLLTAGLFTSPQAIAAALIAFVTMSMGASSVYLLNDVSDVAADRAHKTKRRRPVAAGHVSIPMALAVSGLLMLGAVALSTLLSPAFVLVILGYLFLTTAYTFRLKQVMTADVLTLAALYTVRIVAGAAAIGVVTSFWLLAFSIFFFTSLAYLKRFTELDAQRDKTVMVSGRGYLASDADMVAMSGVACGMVSILVFALFINEMGQGTQYRTPALLWVLGIILLYWLNRLWLMARRGEVLGDPVEHAIKDPRSVIIGAVCIGLVLAARFLDVPFL